MREDQIHYPWIVTGGGRGGYVALLIVKSNITSSCWGIFGVGFCDICT